MIQLLTGLAIIYLPACALVFVFQKSLIYFPDQTPFSDCPAIKDAGGVVVENGEARYYLLKTKRERQGWVIHFHGNGGRACDRLSLVSEFLEMGYNLVLAEYPGYSEDAPLPKQEQLLRSAMAVFEGIKGQAKKERVVLYGESLGAAAATWIASRRKVDALILQTPFPSLAELGKHHYPWLPVKTLLSQKYPAYKWAQEIKAPVFVFHGDKDEVVPFAFGLEQFDNFTSAKKDFWEVKGARHNDIIFVAGAQLWQRLRAFLEPPR